MLTRGEVSQDWIMRRVGDGARAPDIARTLDAVSPHHWRGGLVDERALNMLLQRGPWAAEFRRNHGCIHYVVVDGVTSDGLLRIRDPFGHGSSYLMTRDEFLETWDGVALFSDDPPAHIPVVIPDSGLMPAPPGGFTTGWSPAVDLSRRPAPSVDRPGTPDSL
jgi:Peptidase C39 family